MGALFGGNAGRQWGYKIGDKIVPPSIDRIDGGGPGRSGPRFEGGGLLSDIGNALMRPYGYRDRQAAMQAVRLNARPQGLLTTAPTPAPMRATEVDYADRFAPVPTPRVADRPDYMDMEQPILSAQRARLMPEEYFNRLLQKGYPPDALTPVGQPMTGSELMLMEPFMASASDRPAVVKPAPVAAPAVEPVTAAPRMTDEEAIQYYLDNVLPRQQPGVQRYMRRGLTMQDAGVIRQMIEGGRVAAVRAGR